MLKEHPHTDCTSSRLPSVSVSEFPEAIFGEGSDVHRALSSNVLLRNFEPFFAMLSLFFHPLCDVTLAYLVCLEVRLPFTIEVALVR